MHEPPSAGPAGPEGPAGPAHRLRRRLSWLLACIGAGCAVGAIGHALSGDPIWYAAIGVALTIGWWAHADPTACERPDQRS